MQKSSFTSRFQEWMSEWNELKTRQVLVVVLAVLMGLLIGMVTYTVIKAVFYDLFPRAPLIDFHDSEQAAALLKTDPVGSYWVIAISWAFGTLAAAYCAVRVAKMGQFPAWIAGVLLAAFYLIDLFFQPNTLLIFLLSPVIVAGCAYGGGLLGMYVTVRKQMRMDRNVSEVSPEVSPEISPEM